MPGSAEYREFKPDEFSVAYVETNCELQIANHFHNTYEIIYVLEGTTSVTINTRCYEARAGSMIFISHLESHELRILQYPYKRFYLLIKPQLFHEVISDPRLASIFKHRPEDFNHVAILDEGERNQVASLFNGMKKELDSDLNFKLTGASALLQLLFVFLYRNHTGIFPLSDLNDSANTILQIQKYIDSHCLEAITLKEVAEMFYIDMFYLSRLFKRVCGFSFREYIILQRLSRAKDLLVEGDMPITKVCCSSGFGNVNNFIRIFRKNTGMTPYQYRKKYKNNSLMKRI